MTLTSGTLLNNRYRIVSILGQGGMGAVYRAVDEHLGVSVAVKENLFLTDEYARQFQREAAILGGLRQASLPRVRDYFTVPNQGQYLVMDFIEGEDLRSRIERLRVLPEKDIILIGVLICDALSYLHSRKPPIVHRDIKPGNIKISPEGEAFLVDFGLAKVMTANQATVTGARAMTPGFSPPEQYGTARTDPRTDIYSLGATLYAALTGMIAEDGLARATGKEELTPVRDLEPKVNRRLAGVVERALELDPEDRFQTADEFRKALLDASESPVSADRLTVPPPPIKPSVPVSEEGNELSPDQVEENPAGPQRPRSSKPRKRAEARRRVLMLGSTVILVIIAFLLVLNPELPGKALALLAPSPTVPVPANTVQPTMPLATSTLAALPTLAPTLPPTATFQPSSSPIPSPTPTSIADGLPVIAFSSNRSGSMQIWLMDALGGNLRKLTSKEGGACQPAWSPHGDQIAFVTPCMGKDNYPGGRIFVMDADGLNIHPLPIANNPEGDYDPAWSPDGTKIAYTFHSGQQTQIYVYDFNAQITTNYSNSKTFDSNPAWSPDGKLIAFRRQTAVGLIWLMTDKGQNQTSFNYGDIITNSFGPAWTADGQIILFSQNRVDIGIPWLEGLRLTDQNTNKAFRIPASGQDIGPVAGVSISPDGLWIAYESWPDGKNHDIYRITINGTNETQLTTDASFDFSPAWKPK
jgi:serine/threonine protein kinase